MKKVLLVLAVGLFSCAKEEVHPKPLEQVKTVETVQNTPIKSVSNPDTIQDSIIVDTKDFYFRSRLDDSVTFEYHNITEYGVISNYPFLLSIRITDTLAIKDTNYTNEYLNRNSECPIKINHSVKLIDGSIATPTIGETSTQLHYLEVFNVDSNYCSIRFSCEWYYTHWRDTYKNSNGTLEGEILNIPLK
jgi:hypothetical protein